MEIENEWEKKKKRLNGFHLLHQIKWFLNVAICEKRCSTAFIIIILLFSSKAPHLKIIIIIISALIMFIIEIEQNKSTIGQQCHSELPNGEG